MLKGDSHMNFVPIPKSIVWQDGVCKVAQVAVQTIVKTLPPFVREAYQQAFGGDGRVPLTVRCGESSDAEDYRLTVTPSHITVEAPGYKGAYYALQTLLQAMSGDTIPCMIVEDAPDLPIRGWYQDVSRGRIPTLDTLKRLVDRLASLKMNMLQLYVEHTHRFACYAGIQEDLGFYTDDEIIELDRYCRERCVELVPSLSCFGHLYMLLASKQHRHLCELAEYHPTRHVWHERLMHHTIDPSNPDSVKLITDMIEAYAPLFTSHYFNICCDETFDLCKGKNAGRSVAEWYTAFVGQLIAFLKARGKTVMMWSDIVMKHPEALERLPRDVIYLNWWYDANPAGLHPEVLEQAGCAQIVCPSVNSHKRFVEKLVYSLPNIGGVTRLGKQHGALGVLNTNWGDYGHMCPDENVSFGLAYGAAVAWNTACTDESVLEAAILHHVYRTDRRDVVDVIRTLNACDEIPFAREGYEMAIWELTVQLFDDEWAPPIDLDYRKAVLRDAVLPQKRADALACVARLQTMLEAKAIDGAIGASLLLAARATAAVLSVMDALAHDRTLSASESAEWAAFTADYKTHWFAANKEGEWCTVEAFFNKLAAVGQ